jgi:hypothetical protein
MCQARNAAIARLFSFFEPRSGMLAIRAPDGTSVVENVLNPEGRARIGRFLSNYLKDDARGDTRFLHVPGHMFSDDKAKLVSLINLSSLRDLEARVGARRHRRRFRANVWFSGAAPWSERTWIGQEFQMGGAVLRVVKGITRCKATEVNPETGERDADPVRELRSHYDHIELGILAEVIGPGRFAIGDAIELLGE